MTNPSGIASKDMPRIIIIDNETSEVMLFEDEQQAGAYVEAPDVAGGVYRGYDGEGRLMEVCTDGLETWVQPAEQRPNHESDLRRVLIDYLCSLRSPHAVQFLHDAEVDLPRLDDLPTADLLDMISSLNSAPSESTIKAMMRKVVSAIRRRNPSGK